MLALARELQTKCLELIIPGLFCLLVPITEWFLSHRGTSNRTKQINALLNKIELVEKFHSIQENSSDPLSIKNVVQFCRDDILQRFESLTRRPMVPGRNLPGWRRLLLMYKQRSFMGKVYKVFFYIFSFIGLVVGPVCYLKSWLNNAAKNQRYFVVMGMTFYLVLALLFRALAIHNHKKTAEKLAAQKKMQQIPLLVKPAKNQKQN